MNDYIKREDAIVAYANHEVNVRQGKFEDYRQYMRNVLRSVESVDAVPVVRCKDCKWWTKQEKSIQGRCALAGIYPTGGWYCGNGKREDNE